MTLLNKTIGEYQSRRIEMSQKFLLPSSSSFKVTKYPSFKTFILRVKMGIFWIAK